MITLIISLLGLFVSTVAFAIGGFWGNSVGAFATIITAWAMIRQYLESKPFEMTLDPKCWQERGSWDFRYSIPASVHKKGTTPIVSMLLVSEEPSDHGKLCAVVSSPYISPNGDVELEGGNRSRGKVIIK